MGILDRLGHRLSDFVDDLAGPEHLRLTFERGSEALHAGDLAPAELAFREVLQEQPGSARALHLLGVALLGQGKSPEAARTLERARDLRPDDFDILTMLAEAQRRSGRSEEALRSYKQALLGRAEDPLLAVVFEGIGELYLERGEAERAVRELRKAAALSRGEDLRLLGRLGVAQYRCGKLDLARATLSRAATAQPLEREVVLLLAEVLCELGRPEEAQLAALRVLAADDRSAPARTARARALLALGKPEDARMELLRALAHDPRNVDAHLTLARVQVSAQNPDGARSHLRIVTDLLGRNAPGERTAVVVDLYHRTIELELEQEPLATGALAGDAEALLTLRPDDPWGLAARAVNGLDRAEDSAALLERAAGIAETFAGWMGWGLYHLRRGAGAEAAIAFHHAVRLRPESRRARDLLARAYDLQSGVDEIVEDHAGLYPLIRRTHRLFTHQTFWGALGPEAARIQEVFDRPLLVTVMGEFNTGKSTFVNALIGEQVAPMGIVPTTATINVLKYGARRAARVVWRDDREQLLEWSEVRRFMSGLDRRRASAIRLVEILIPAEELLRVNVVDTPGMNSMLEEHEETAREFLAQADAVIWLFSADQAGKQTEEQALAIIREHRLKTVGVINKIDRLTAAELMQVETHLRAGFADLVEAFIPVSARSALEAIVEARPDELEQSRFPELRRYLEEQLFARSRAIKREVGIRRLRDLLTRAEREVGAELDRADGGVKQVQDLHARVPRELSLELLEEEKRRLLHALEEVYRHGAAEVLDFVRPRRWVLGEHRSSAADRDFLLELLVEGLHEMGVASFRRMEAQLQHTAQQLERGLTRAGGSPERLRSERLHHLVAERMALLQQQVYTRFTAFARGYLRGGRVDHFFSRRLPHLDLALEPISEALMADAVDLDHELLRPLTQWYEGSGAALDQLMYEFQSQLELHRLEIDRRYMVPLLRIRDLLERRPAKGGDATGEEDPPTTAGGVDLPDERGSPPPRGRA